MLNVDVVKVFQLTVKRNLPLDDWCKKKKQFSPKIDKIEDENWFEAWLHWRHSMSVTI